MKKFYATILAALLCGGSQAQVVLNEIYAEPSATQHEFFELYNTSYNGLPVSLDGYTIMSYFEEGRTRGFYVLDLPNLSIAPKGYFVGSAALPFNYQGGNGSTDADFNWNSPTLLTNYGYLRKWVATGNTAADGNRNYDIVPMPTGTNDFFTRLVGNTASYNAFVYKNGVLVNSFVGGTGGSTNTLPASIANMPVFRLENVTTAGTRTYNVSWNNLKNKKPEYVIPDIGSSNGFIREQDGMCGTWDKSSAQAFHTPKRPNGGNQMDVVGLLTLDTHIYPGANPGDASFVVYNITSGPADLFPVELHVYADDGTVNGELDAADTFIEANTESAVGDGAFTTYFNPPYQDLLIVAQTAAGCWDQIKYLPNLEIAKTALPLQLRMFTGRYRQGRSELEWVVSANEAGAHFEVEKSTDGRNFSKAATVYTTPQEGDAYYTFSENVSGGVFYRLRLVNRDRSTSQSAVVLVKNEMSVAAPLRISPNPVGPTLVFTYEAAHAETVTMNLYNSVGARVISRQLAAQKGINRYSIPLGAEIKSGAWLLELSGTYGKSMEQFIRR